MIKELTELSYEPKSQGAAFRCNDGSVRYVINRESHLGGENHVVAILRIDEESKLWLANYSGEVLEGHCHGPQYSSIREGPFLLNQNAREKLAEGFGIRDIDLSGIEKKTIWELISLAKEEEIIRGKNEK